ncbi:MAG: translocation/assembly module TamB domain-containing protein [Alphaproteobacteria bacterium]|nr:translocation/assembly module TamB domain-containing protein [Alphaproteobacteria bacterium]MCB9792608.1 translocation/assembly module TamB domain-containing protein [Alphaproteobacteria bacterium]
MSTTPKQRRPLHQRRGLRLGAGLLLLLVAAHAVLGSAGFRRWLTGQVEDALAEALGEDVSIGDVRVQPLRASVQLDGLVVRSRRTGRLLLGLDGARARFGLGPEGPRLRLLEVNGPVIDVALKDGALMDFPGLTQGADAGSGELPERLPWDELIVRKADLRLSLYGEEETPRASLRVDDLELRPDLRPPKVDVQIASVTLTVGEHVERAEDIRVFGAILGPDRVFIPDLHVETQLLRADARLEVELRGDLDGYVQLAISDTALSELLGPRADLEGEVLADLVLTGTADAPSAEIALSAQPTLIVRGEEPEREARYDFGEVTASAIARREGLRVSPLVLRWGDGRVSAEGDIAWDGALSGASVRGDDLSFARIFQQVGQTEAPWVDFRGDVEIGLTGTLSPLALSGPAEVVAEDFRVASGPVEQSDLLLAMSTLSLLGELSLNGEGVRIDGRRLQGNHSRGTVDAWLGFAGESSRPPLDIRFDLFDADLGDFQPLGGAGLQGRGRVQGRVWGPYGAPRILGQADVRDFACVGVPWADQMSTELVSDDLRSLEVRGFKALRGETEVKGDLTLRFEERLGLETQALVGGGRLSDLIGMFIDLPGVEGAVSGTLSLSGPYDALDGEGRFSLSAVELYGERFDQGRAVGIMQEGRFTLDELVLTRLEGQESLLARGSVGAGWATSIDLQSDGMRLERLDALAGMENPPMGSVTLEAVVGGTLFAPEPAGRLTAHELRHEGSFLPDGRVDFTTEGETLRFAGGLLDGSVAGSGGWRVFDDQAVSLDFELHDAPAHVVAPLVVDGKPVLIQLTGEGHLEASLAGDAPLRLETIGEQTTLRWGRHELRNPEPWLLRIDGPEVRTEGLRLVGGRTDLVLSATRSRSGEALITGGGQLDLELMQLATGETLQGEGTGKVLLALNGPLDALDGRVQVSTEDATLRSDAFPHAFERVDAQIEGSPRGYEVRTLTGEVGGGRFEVSGRVQAEGWVPVALDIDADVQDARVRYLDDLPAMVGDATLSLDGPPDELLLSGDIRVEQMQFSERLDWEQWATDFRERRLTGIVEDEQAEDGLLDLDLRISGDGSVRIRNNVADGLASMDLRVVGDSARPGMVGEVRMLPGGRFFYEDRDFDVTRAELHYVDPWSFDPELDFVLETDIRTGERSYHVVLPVTGPFSDWRAEPRSEPSLPQGDINALILFGVTRDEIEQLGGAGSALFMEGLDLWITGEGQRALERWGNGVLQNTKVDLLTGVSSRGTVLSSDWRVLVERDVPEPWELTFIGEFNPFRLDDQYLAVERNLTGNIYLNLFWSSYERERDLSIGGAYGADFRVRWEVE